MKNKARSFWKALTKSGMLQRPSKSVGVKLFIIFVVSIVLFVFSVGTISYMLSRDAIKERVSTSSYQTMIQAAEKLDLMLNQFSNLTMQIMLDPNLTESMDKLDEVKEGTYDKVQLIEKIQETLQTYSVGNNLIENVYLIPLDGERQQFSALGMRRGVQSAADKPWFDAVQNSKGQAVWIDTMPTGLEQSHAPTFGIARPLRDLLSGKAHYIIFLEIRMHALAQELKGIQLGDGSSVHVLNPTGQYIYTLDQAMLTKEAPQWLVPKKEQESSELLSGSKTVTSDQDEQILLAYHPLKSSNWELVGTVPVKQLVKDADFILLVTFILMIAAAILAAVIGWFVMRMIAKPLHTLRDLMNEGAQGNLAVRASVKTKDEIGELAHGFNTMMEQITTLVQHTEASARSVLETAVSLTDASRSTAVSAKEIAIATEEIAKGASSLAVEAERGHDLTHQMAMQMQMVVAANEQMDHSAQEVSRSSELGASNMTTLLTRTSTTEETMRTLSDRVNKLNENTQSIRKILELLQNMTKQTNILSLNATIEAARAGAAGKGFMVVADEIRSLADQSRQSIDVVGQITVSIQAEIKETVDALAQAFPMFSLQAEAVKETDSIFSAVTEQMGGMVGKLSDVTESVERLNHSQAILVEAMSNVSAVAEEASATSEEVASLSTEQLSISNRLVDLSHQLEEVSQQLKATLSKFSY
ncbi:methyl-accepting chemotaxis protein [Paenibacillus sp. 481]|uniref:methyl-accepting chemotaxis protein n=1 Tax=Paenibacillus sp. 481 TaxID=2835869 RepID=UPI001E2EA29F|nr:methyl-accepting chemotaxis protein [Paenibacillus sp. 481]UHA72040.1 methyl-accepting chemotaxis protein [Paenibacillus sp. 481]